MRGDLEGTRVHLMAAGVGTDPTLGTTSAVGRYFGLVSTVPSVLMAAWVYLLLAAGATAADGPTWDHLTKNNPFSHPAELAAAAAFALAVAIVGHPLQFAIVQLLEGYWGTSRLAINLGERAVLRQLRRRARVVDLGGDAEELRDMLPPGRANAHVSKAVLQEDPERARIAVRSQLMADASAATMDRYPLDAAATMPTALGNALRRHELIAGKAVGLPILAWATYVGMVADPAHTRYVNDQRALLDLAARLASSAALASAFTFAVLWDDGKVALWTLVPYVVAWLAFRGAVVCVGSYGAALQAWVDLNRFKVYEALGLEPQTSLSAEHDRNLKLTAFLAGEAVDFPVNPPIPGTAGTHTQ